MAFRGTEQVKWKDFITDLNVVPTSFNVERAWEGGGLGSLFFKAQKKVAGSKPPAYVPPVFFSFPFLFFSFFLAIQDLEDL